MGFLDTFSSGAGAVGAGLGFAGDLSSFGASLSVFCGEHDKNAKKANTALSLIGAASGMIGGVSNTIGTWSDPSLSGHTGHKVADTIGNLLSMGSNLAVGMDAGYGLAAESASGDEKKALETKQNTARIVGGGLGLIGGVYDIIKSPIQAYRAKNRAKREFLGDEADNLRSKKEVDNAVKNKILRYQRIVGEVLGQEALDKTGGDADKTEDALEKALSQMQKKRKRSETFESLSADEKKRLRTYLSGKSQRKMSLASGIIGGVGKMITGASSVGSGILGLQGDTESGWNMAAKVGMSLGTGISAIGSGVGTAGAFKGVLSATSGNSGGQQRNDPLDAADGDNDDDRLTGLRNARMDAPGDLDGDDDDPLGGPIERPGRGAPKDDAPKGGAPMGGDAPKGADAPGGTDTSGGSGSAKAARPPGGTDASTGIVGPTAADGSSLTTVSTTGSSKDGSKGGGMQPPGSRSADDPMAADIGSGASAKDADDSESDDDDDASEPDDSGADDGSKGLADSGSLDGAKDLADSGSADGLKDLADSGSADGEKPPSDEGSGDDEDAKDEE